jgi:NitT/TauT family transport system substrate-binding protein
MFIRSFVAAAATALGVVVGASGLVCGAAQAQDKVTVGYTQTATDIGLYVADKRGYFKQEGLDVQFMNFDSAARMIAPIASGDLQVIAGAASAGLYNAVARGIDIRMVADKVSTPPGRTSQTLIVRKDLVDSGRYKTLADLKGMKIANSAPGTAASVTLVKMLNSAGLKIGDIDQTFLAFPQHVVALTNKAVDAALPAEPATTEAVNRGLAVKVLTDDQAYPNHQIAVIFFSGKFATEKPDAAKRFLKAFLRGVRDHNDALGPDGRFVGEKGEAIIRILNEMTPIKDPQFYRDFPLAACNPDGTMNIDSLKTDLAVLREQGLIEGEVNVDKAIDLTFLQAALKELGPYKRAN